MHWIITDAGLTSRSAEGSPSTATWLPLLSSALRAARVVATVGGDEAAYAMPHELAWSDAVGLGGVDGLSGWGLAQAQADGLLTPSNELADAATAPHQAWALLSPVHLRVAMDHVGLVTANEVALNEAESRALFATVQAHLQGDGFLMRWGAIDRWYLWHESLLDLRTASIERVAGHGLEDWLPQGDAALAWRRLQNELQMLLHAHAVNDARSERGRPEINSVWLSGTAPRQPSTPDVSRMASVRIDRRLALASDVATWSNTWHQVIDELLAKVAQATKPGVDAFRLTLSDRRRAVTLDFPVARWWSRWTRTPLDVEATLRSLDARP